MNSPFAKPAVLIKILVAGIGNPDRGDDGVGLRVIAELAGRLPPDVVLITRSGDILALVEDWTGFNATICIDAADFMAAPGRIHRIDAAAGELPPGLAFPSSHAFGLAEAIALAGALQRLPETVIVFAIEGKNFDGGAPMTPEVAAAAAKTAEQVIAEIARLCRNAGCYGQEVVTHA